MRLVMLMVMASVVSSTSVQAKDKGTVIHIYGGLGTPARVRVWGRALEWEASAAEPSLSKAKREHWPTKLLRNVEALESDELPGAVVELTLGGAKATVSAYKEGLFRVDLVGNFRPGRQMVQAKLQQPASAARLVASAVQVVPAGAGLAVVSDIDDTVLLTGVGNKLKLAVKTLFTGATDLKPVPGAAPVLRALSARGCPITFVSGSPVNLFPKLSRFLFLNQFPEATLLLKDFALNNLSDQRTYKRGQLEQVLELLPGYRLILIGDSGEQDPEIYDDLRQRFAGRVELVFIRDVGRKGKRARPGQHWFRNWVEVEQTLRSRGLLGPSQPAQVAPPARTAPKVQP